MNPFVFFISAWFLPKRFRRYAGKKRIRAARLLWSRVDWSIKVAISITVAFFVILFLFAFTPGCPSGEDCGTSGYKYFLNASPNEVGDTLAGVAGTLAFLWLIVTVMLQGKELAAQRRELSLARKETAKMAKSQEQQVNLLIEHSKYLETEFEDRKSDRVRKLLSVQLQSLSDLLDLESKHGDLFALTALKNKVLFSGRDGRTVDAHIYANRHAPGAFFALHQDMDFSGASVLSGSILPYVEVLALCKGIEKLRERLPEDELFRLERIGFFELTKNMDQFVDGDVWANEAHDPGNPSNFLKEQF